MTAAAMKSRLESNGQLWNKVFLRILPSIQCQARFAFARQPSERCQDLVAEVVANTFVAFIQLARRGKLDVARPTPLAQFAIRQVLCGRRVGTKLNSQDVTSEYAQRLRRLSRASLCEWGASDCWQEVLIENRRSSPADIAAFRIDFHAWLQTLPARSRQVAELLATGESTKEAAKQFGISPGRISQLRRELNKSWNAFQGDATGQAA